MGEAPLRARLIERLRFVWVPVGAVVGTVIPVRVVTAGGNVAWWAWVLLAVSGLAPGIAAGRWFAERERDVALPTPIAAGVASLLVGLASPFVFLALWLLTWLATGRHPD